MDPEDVVLAEPLDDGRGGVLPPEHPAAADDATSAGEVLSEGNPPTRTALPPSDDTRR
jgi:hypothetical protein